MGDVDYFLDTSFNLFRKKIRNISVHLCQSAFTEFTAHRFSVQIANKVPNMTPYQSRFTIDAIPPIHPLDPDLHCQRQVYHIIVGYINWLTACTCHDIAPVLPFLASHIKSPHPEHYKAVVHALKYITRTNEYSISFH